MNITLYVLLGLMAIFVYATIGIAVQKISLERKWKPCRGREGHYSTFKEAPNAGISCYCKSNSSMNGVFWLAAGIGWLLWLILKYILVVPCAFFGIRVAKLVVWLSKGPQRCGSYIAEWANGI